MVVFVTFISGWSKVERLASENIHLWYALGTNPESWIRVMWRKWWIPGYSLMRERKSRNSETIDKNLRTANFSPTTRALQREKGLYHLPSHSFSNNIIFKRLFLLILVNSKINTDFVLLLQNWIMQICLHFLTQILHWKRRRYRMFTDL